MASEEEIVEALAGMALFSDLSGPELAGVAHAFEERYFPAGERIIREGLTGSAFHVILDGDVSVVVDGEPRTTLGRGEFFGEMSILLGEPPSADVVALRPLRCLVLAGPDLQGFLVAHPRVTFRMLQAEARRLGNAIRWRG